MLKRWMAKFRKAEPGPEPDQPLDALYLPDLPGQEDIPAEPEAPETEIKGSEAGSTEEFAGTGRIGRSAFFSRLRERMGKTRSGLVRRMDKLLLGKREIDPELLDEIEEILVTSDLGMKTVIEIIDQVREEVNRKELRDPTLLRARLKERIRSFLVVPARPIAWVPKPFVILVVGVNGVGKTTTIAKLAHNLKEEGKSVLLVAGDTFRAAAGEQLEVWGKRLDFPVVRHQEGADPSAVVFDGIEAGVRRGADVVIVDTAGRLHTKSNLMEELKKIRRVIGKRLPGAPHEVFLVLDATTGQNALSQTRLFKDAVDVTGIILTKLDGTAKGGIIVSIAREFGIPIRYIGIGETMEDLRPFDPADFVDAIFSEED